MNNRAQMADDWPMLLLIAAWGGALVGGITVQTLQPPALYVGGLGGGAIGLLLFSWHTAFKRRKQLEKWVNTERENT